MTLRGSYSKIYKLKIIKIVFKNARKIVTPSTRLRNDLNTLFDIELMPHGVDNEWFICEKKVINPGPLKVITVARLHDWKNIHMVIQSVANLIHSGVKIDYTIVGEGYYEKVLRDLVEKNKINDHVKFYSFLSADELRSLYKVNNIFILLSYPETFGRVYFEAAAQGLLLIGRKGTGIDGYFDSKEAFIIKPTIAETMKVLLEVNNNVFNEMTFKSRNKILDFRNDKIIKRYYNIISGLKIGNI